MPLLSDDLNAFWGGFWTTRIGFAFTIPPFGFSRRLGTVLDGLLRSRRFWGAFWDQWASAWASAWSSAWFGTVLLRDDGAAAFEARCVAFWVAVCVV